MMTAAQLFPPQPEADPAAGQASSALIPFGQVLRRGASPGLLFIERSSIPVMQLCKGLLLGIIVASAPGIVKWNLYVTRIFLFPGKYTAERQVFLV